MNSANLPFKITAATSFDKEIIVPGSKSHANRALILGAIRGDYFKIHNIPDSTDVTHMISALKKIGLKIKMTGTTLVFENSFPACEKDVADEIVTLNTGDGGTTNRFLLALLSRGKKEYHLFPTEKMSERPIDDLLITLKKLDVHLVHNQDVSAGVPWVIVKGAASLYNTTKLAIDCSKSTQFASAMMLAFSNRPLQFEFLNLNASEAYLKMTSQVIKKSIESNSYTIPVDFSSLGYPAALAAIQGKVLIKNCQEIDSVQADSVFVETLKNIGALRSLTTNGLEIKKGISLKPFSFDISKAPDLFPTLVFLSSHINGESKFFNLGVLAFKESARLDEMISMLKSFGVEYFHDAGADTLTIKGKSNFLYNLATIRPARDHRIVMAAALFMRVNRGGELYEADCVEKSFPGFFKILFNL
jgi:3-phosphoshikimate 1-carboxyvinyltransferase